MLVRTAAAPVFHRAMNLLVGVGSRAQCAVRLLLDGGYHPDAAEAAAPVPARIDIDDLWIDYGERIALEGVSLRLEPGTLTAVVGPNGAGKSSLLKAIAGLLPPRRGQIAGAGRQGHRLAYLPQSTEVDRDFPVSVAELVTLGAWRTFGAFRRPAGPILPEVDAAMAATGLEGMGDRLISALSVGEFQRALFARVLLQNAALILLDEPFMALDERTTEDLLGLMRRWHQEGRTVLAVLHDLEQVRGHFPSALLLARTLIAFGESASVLSQENLHRARAALGGASRLAVAL